MKLVLLPILLVTLAGCQASLSKEEARKAMELIPAVVISTLEIEETGASKTKGSDTCQFSWAKIKLFDGMARTPEANGNMAKCQHRDFMVEFKRCKDTTGTWGSWTPFTADRYWDGNSLLCPTPGK